MKKFVSILLSIVFILCAVSISGSAIKSDTDSKLQFNADGSFRILQITDIQDGPLLLPITADYISDAIKTAKPDLVVLTGDNIGGYSCKTNFETFTAITSFMNIFEYYGVKVAIVFGNHDYDENEMTKDAQMKIYEKYSCFVGKAGDESLEGCGTYNLPILSSDGEKTAFNLYMIDSQSYNDENDLGGYGCVAKNQVEWYKNKSDELKEANGGNVVPSMVFQHIIVPEIYDALEVVDADGDYTQENDDVYYKIPSEDIDDDTAFNEPCCPPKYSNGEFDAMVEKGDTMAIFVGHDHMNSFVVPYKGIDICSTPGIGFASYGDEGRGYRVIDLNEKDTSTYSTYVTSYFEQYDRNNDADSIRFSLYNSELFSDEGISAFFKYLLVKVFSIFLAR